MNPLEDEKQIRKVIADWMEATAAGDVERLADLMSGEIVFLQAGHPPLKGRDAFASGFRAALQQVTLKCSSDIQEVQVSGDQAFCWNHLTVEMQPLQGGPSKKRSGPVLSVFRREADGRWRLFRDANLLT